MEPGAVDNGTVDVVRAVDGGSRVMLAADVWPESEEVAAVDVGLDSQEDVGLEVAVEEVRLDSQELTNADSVDPLLLNAEDSVDPPQNSIVALQDSVDMVPESLPPGAFVCGRCHLVHEDREAWNRAHSRFYPCPSCGLVHADYAIDAMLGRIKVYCKLFMEHYKGLLPTNDAAKASVR